MLRVEALKPTYNILHIILLALILLEIVSPISNSLEIYTYDSISDIRRGNAVIINQTGYTIPLIMSPCDSCTYHNVGAYYIKGGTIFFDYIEQRTLKSTARQAKFLLVHIIRGDGNNPKDMALIQYTLYKDYQPVKIIQFPATIIGEKEEPWVSGIFNKEEEYYLGFVDRHGTVSANDISMLFSIFEPNHLQYIVGAVTDLNTNDMEKPVALVNAILYDKREDALVIGTNEVEITDPYYPPSSFFTHLHALYLKERVEELFLPFKIIKVSKYDSIYVGLVFIGVRADKAFKRVEFDKAYLGIGYPDDHIAPDAITYIKIETEPYLFASSSQRLSINDLISLYYQLIDVTYKKDKDRVDLFVVIKDPLLGLWRPMLAYKFFDITFLLRKKEVIINKLFTINIAEGVAELGGTKSINMIMYKDQVILSLKAAIYRDKYAYIPLIALYNTSERSIVDYYVIPELEAKPSFGAPSVILKGDSLVLHWITPRYSDDVQLIRRRIFSIEEMKFIGETRNGYKRFYRRVRGIDRFTVPVEELKPQQPREGKGAFRLVSLLLSNELYNLLRIEFRNIDNELMKDYMEISINGTRYTVKDGVFKGYYKEGSILSITVPLESESYVFNEWGDGRKSNNIFVTVKGNISLIVYYKYKPELESYEAQVEETNSPIYRKITVSGRITADNAPVSGGGIKIVLSYSKGLFNLTYQGVVNTGMHGEFVYSFYGVLLLEEYNVTIIFLGNNRVANYSWRRHLDLVVNEVVVAGLTNTSSTLRVLPDWFFIVVNGTRINGSVAVIPADHLPLSINVPAMLEGFVFNKWITGEETSIITVDKPGVYYALYRIPGRLSIEEINVRGETPYKAKVNVTVKYTDYYGEPVVKEPIYISIYNDEYGVSTNITTGHDGVAKAQLELNFSNPRCSEDGCLIHNLSFNIFIYHNETEYYTPVYNFTSINMTIYRVNISIIDTFENPVSGAKASISGYTITKPKEVVWIVAGIYSISTETTINNNLVFKSIIVDKTSYSSPTVTVALIEPTSIKIVYYVKTEIDIVGKEEIPINKSAYMLSFSGTLRDAYGNTLPHKLILITIKDLAGNLVKIIAVNTRAMGVFNASTIISSGTYKVEVSFSGDNYYYGCSKHFTTTNYRYVKIYFYDTKNHRLTRYRIGGNVYAYLGTYMKSSSNGVVVFYVPMGQYNVKVPDLLRGFEFRKWGDGRTSSSIGINVTSSITLKVYYKIPVKFTNVEIKLTKILGQKYMVSGLLKDFYGYYLGEGKVYIKIYYQSNNSLVYSGQYTLYWSSNGVFRFTNIHLPAGYTYRVELKYHDPSDKYRDETYTVFYSTPTEEPVEFKAYLVIYQGGWRYIDIDIPITIKYDSLRESITTPYSSKLLSLVYTISVPRSHDGKYLQRIKVEYLLTGTAKIYYSSSFKLRVNESIRITLYYTLPPRQVPVTILDPAVRIVLTDDLTPAFDVSGYLYFTNGTPVASVPVVFEAYDQIKDGVLTGSTYTDDYGYFHVIVEGATYHDYLVRIYNIPVMINETTALGIDMVTRYVNLSKKYFLRIDLSTKCSCCQIPGTTYIRIDGRTYYGNSVEAKLAEDRYLVEVPQTIKVGRRTLVLYNWMSPYRTKRVAAYGSKVWVYLIHHISLVAYYRIRAKFVDMQIIRRENTNNVTITISGYLLEDGTNNPLPNMTVGVIIKPVSSSLSGRTSIMNTTDSDGYFEITFVLYPGKYSVSVVLTEIRNSCYYAEPKAYTIDIPFILVVSAKDVLYSNDLPGFSVKIDNTETIADNDNDAFINIRLYPGVHTITFNGINGFLPKYVTGSQPIGFVAGGSITLDLRNTSMPIYIGMATCYYKVPTSITMHVKIVQSTGSGVRAQVVGRLTDYYGSGISSADIKITIISSYTLQYYVKTNASGYFTSHVHFFYYNMEYAIKALYSGSLVYVYASSEIEYKPIQAPTYKLEIIVKAMDNNNPVPPNGYIITVTVQGTNGYTASLSVDLSKKNAVEFTGIPSGTYYVYIDREIPYTDPSYNLRYVFYGWYSTRGNRIGNSIPLRIVVNSDKTIYVKYRVPSEIVNLRATKIYYNYIGISGKLVNVHGTVLANKPINITIIDLSINQVISTEVVHTDRNGEFTLNYRLSGNDGTVTLLIKALFKGDRVNLGTTSITYYGYGVYSVCISAKDALNNTLPNSWFKVIVLTKDNNILTVIEGSNPATINLFNDTYTFVVPVALGNFTFYEWDNGVTITNRTVAVNTNLRLVAYYRIPVYIANATKILEPSIYSNLTLLGFKVDLVDYYGNNVTDGMIFVSLLNVRTNEIKYLEFGVSGTSYTELKDSLYHVVVYYTGSEIHYPVSIDFNLTVHVYMLKIIEKDTEDYELPVQAILINGTVLSSNGTLVLKTARARMKDGPSLRLEIEPVLYIGEYRFRSWSLGMPRTVYLVFNSSVKEYRINITYLTPIEITILGYRYIEAHNSTADVLVKGSIASVHGTPISGAQLSVALIDINTSTVTQLSIVSSKGLFSFIVNASIGHMYVIIIRSKMTYTYTGGCTNYTILVKPVRINIVVKDTLGNTINTTVPIVINSTKYDILGSSKLVLVPSMYMFAVDSVLDEGYTLAYVDVDDNRYNRSTVLLRIDRDKTVAIVYKIPSKLAIKVSKLVEGITYSKLLVSGELRNLYGSPIYNATVSIIVARYRSIVANETSLALNGSIAMEITLTKPGLYFINVSYQGSDTYVGSRNSTYVIIESIPVTVSIHPFPDKLLQLRPILVINSSVDNITIPVTAALTPIYLPKTNLSLLILVNSSIIGMHDIDLTMYNASANITIELNGVVMDNGLVLLADLGERILDVGVRNFNGVTIIDIRIDGKDDFTLFLYVDEMYDRIRVEAVANISSISYSYIDGVVVIEGKHMCPAELRLYLYSPGTITPASEPVFIQLLLLALLFITVYLRRRNAA